MPCSDSGRDCRIEVLGSIAGAAKSEFEMAAVAKIEAEEPHAEATATVDGNQVRQAATSVRVVMEICLMCHENVPKGQPIGAITCGFPLKQ